MKVAELYEAEQARLALVKEKRRRVDALRVQHDRVRRELEALELAGRSPAAIELMRGQLARTTAELRAASRELVASI